MNRIVLVHGINNHGKSEDQLIGEWFGALQTVLPPEDMASLQSMDVRAPYYGDVLEAKTDAAGFLPDPTEQSLEAVDDPASAFIAQSITEMAMSAGLSAELMGAESSGEAVEQSLIMNRYVNAGLRFLERLSPWRLRYGMILLRQAYVYLNLADARQAVDEIVAPHLTLDKPTLIIAHSLGTIVAFKALRESSGDPVNHLITLGSPLGLKAVKNTIGPAFAIPSSVSNWANALDPDDIVTLGSTLEASGYEATGLTETNQIENGRQDPHSIARYLTSPWMVKRLQDALSH